MPLEMPVPICGYEYDQHFHHHFNCDTGPTGGRLDAPIAMGHCGGDIEDAALSVGTDLGGFDAAINSVLIEQQFTVSLTCFNDFESLLV